MFCFPLNCAPISKCVFMLQGMLSARGKTLLFADADGASTFADVAKLEAELEKINTTEVRIVIYKYMYIYIFIYIYI